MKNKINYYLFNDGDNIVIITENGNVGNTHNNGEYLLVECYSDTINNDTVFDNIWDDLGEGRLYTFDWDGKLKPFKSKPDEEVIQSILHYFHDSENNDFVKNEMGEFTEDNFCSIALNPADE